MNAPVEEVLDGITFTASAGGFAIAEITASNYTINKENVEFTFTLQPQDEFISTAVLKLVLPTQLYIKETAALIATTGVMSKDGATVEVLFNRIVYIYNAFPNGFVPTEPGSPFSFTLQGFRNPQNSQPTDSFEVKIFYQELTNEVSHYQGLNLFFQAEASHAISLESYLTEDLTGEL